MARPISEIAADIRREWKPKVNYAAAPYLDAMEMLDKPTDVYGCDSAKGIVLYFLGNASTFKGEKAKALKSELKSIVGVK